MAASGFTAFLTIAVVVGPIWGHFWDAGVIPKGLVYTALSSNLSTDFVNIHISDLNLFMFKTPKAVCFLQSTLTDTSLFRYNHSTLIAELSATS